MPKVVSVGIAPPPHVMTQDTVVQFAKDLFGNTFKDIGRLLKIFANGQIEKRHFAKELTWFEHDHTLEERNNAYIESAVALGVAAIERCLTDREFLREHVPVQEIDAFFFISSTGFATPTIDAKIMNILPFHEHTKRIPIWGLGCAGGASGLSRAFEYCKAFPKAKVLVLAVELCSLTFQRNDASKSNLIGTSLFADGVAAVLVVGDEVRVSSALPVLPVYKDAESTFMKQAEDVMGWDIRNEGLYVIFSKDIPTIIEGWLRPNVEKFLEKQGKRLYDMDHFIAHPGGKKVLDAYETSLQMEKEKMKVAADVLRQYGNMSAPTVLYVLAAYMKQVRLPGEKGLIAALGPGFSAELLYVEWECA